MTISVASIMTRSDDLLNDIGGIRWPYVERVNWLNDGQREVVMHKPEASAVNAPVQLAAGTKQAIPAIGVRLLDVVRNMGAAGTTPGRSIRIVEREIMDAQLPDWHNATAASTIKHFMFDERNPRNFYVYPPVTGAPYVEMIYSSSPVDCTLGGNISLDDIYGNVLLDYVLYRAHSKDAEYAANAQRAQAYYQLVASALGIKSRTDVAASPNATHMGGS